MIVKVMKKPVPVVEWWRAQDLRARANGAPHPRVAGADCAGFAGMPGVARLSHVPRAMPFMIVVLRRMLRMTLALAAAAGVGVGCDATPPPVSPVPTGDSAASTPLEGPRIVGTVRVPSNENMPPPRGGLVYLEDAPKQPGVATTAAIDVRRKEFSPFIAVITTGGSVTFGNKDALTHHVFSPDVPNWDTGNLGKNETAERKFDAPGVIALLCNVHPEMVGYLLVVPSTYFGKLGADGTYVIANVPPGTYKATAWAPRMVNATQSVTVSATGAVTADFELQPGPK
jgi:plastocyanin